jgi:hypothetical protein
LESGWVISLSRHTAAQHLGSLFTGRSNQAALEHTEDSIPCGGQLNRTVQHGGQSAVDISAQGQSAVDVSAQGQLAVDVSAQGQSAVDVSAQGQLVEVS